MYKLKRPYITNPPSMISATVTPNLANSTFPHMPLLTELKIWPCLVGTTFHAILLSCVILFSQFSVETD